MTKEEIQAIFERILTWPSERLDDVGEVLLGMEAANDAAGDLAEEDWAGLEKGLAGADRGEFASDKQMQALFTRYRWPLTAEERAELEEAEREIDRGEVASDEEVAQILPAQAQVKLSFSTVASRQISGIHVYIARDNPYAAADVVDRILEVAEFVAANPGVGRATLVRGMRALPVRPYPYVIYFRKLRDEVRVVRVLHSARRQPELREEGLLVIRPNSRTPLTFDDPARIFAR